MDYGGGFSRGRSPDRRNNAFGGGNHSGGGGGGFRRADLVNQLTATASHPTPPSRDFDFREQQQSKQQPQVWGSGDEFGRGRGGDRDRDRDFRNPTTGAPMGDAFSNGRGKPENRNFLDRSNFEQDSFSSNRGGPSGGLAPPAGSTLLRSGGNLPSSNLSSAFGGPPSDSSFLSRNQPPLEPKRSGGSWNPDPLDSSFNLTRKREASPVAGGPAPKRSELGLSRPFDAGILICKNSLRDYGELIERRLLELNLAVDVMFVTTTEDHVGLIVEQMAQKGMLYCVVIQKQHEAHKSITVNVLHGSPQEHRNMPLEDALVMLSRDFNEYLNKLRVGSEQPSLSFLLHLLTDGKHLSSVEIDRISSHLEERKKKMTSTLEAPVQPNLPSDTKKPEDRKISDAPQDGKGSSASQLQQHIFKILGTGKDTNSEQPKLEQPKAPKDPFGLDQNTPVHSTPVPMDIVGGQQSGSSNFSQSHTEGKPDIQKALAALLKNPDLLQSLKPPGSQAGAMTGQNTAPSSSQSSVGDPNRGGISSLLGPGIGRNDNAQMSTGMQPGLGLGGQMSGGGQSGQNQMGQQQSVFGSPNRGLNLGGMPGFNQGLAGGMNQLGQGAGLGNQFGVRNQQQQQQPQVLPGSMFGSMIPPGNLMGPGPQSLMGGPQLNMMLAQQQQQQMGGGMNQQGGVWNRGPPGQNRNLLG